MRRLQRLLLACGAAALLLGSLATALLLRKPAPAALLESEAASSAGPPVDLPALRRLPVARPVPDLAFEDADGTTHTLHEFAGRPVLLNLWATWCSPCVAELPSLAALRPRAEQDGLVVLALSLDHGGTARVRAFFASHGISGLAVWNDRAGKAEQALDLRGIPTTLVIDRQGRELARLEGGADWNAPGALATLRRLVE